VQLKRKCVARAFIAGVLLLLSFTTQADQPAEVVVHPLPYDGPLRNPLMGFIGPLNGRHPYASLAREYVRWNDIESSASDGVEKLVAYGNKRWGGVEQRNMKVIPRVFLEWPKGTSDDPYWPIESFWPQDMPRDFQSPQFKERVVAMIRKMGEAWDNDPRIAFIEMGLIGPWGEHHHPSPTPELQQLLGDAFQAAFNNKLVMNRYPWEFKNHQFGIHWDSFGNPGWEMRKHVPELEGSARRWATAPMAGEMAFSKDPESGPLRLAKTPTDAVAHHAATLARYIRRWHWSALGWVSNYDQADPAALEGAALLQKTFGYRFVLDEVRFPARVEPGDTLHVAFTVRNLGSAPFYYRWPVELSLLNADTGQPLWRTRFTAADIRTWQPGDFSDQGKGRPVGDKNTQTFEWDTGSEYDIPAIPHHIEEAFLLPADLPSGHYFLALAILDPAGGLPAVKFATRNYLQGGRHPIGRLAVGAAPSDPSIDQARFTDPALDTSLHYLPVTAD
jgi:hypothetical protein